MRKNRVLFIYGTRPEAIKMAPLVKTLQRNPEVFETRICLTGQHREMLSQVNDFFGIKADYNLDLMRPGQSLAEFNARCLAALDPVIAGEAADMVFVQGDTTSVLVGALAAYYHSTAVAHLEAGLRSGDPYSPFPEEMNRKLVGQIASYHFAPTRTAAENLRREGITKNVYIVGNTVIDALQLGLNLIKAQGDAEYRREFGFLDPAKRIILVTGHRRESFGGGMERICDALKVLASTCQNTQIVYPVHLNPNVQKPVRRILGGLPTVHLIEPIGYPSMLWLLDQSAIVLTDSGGIQEEAPALGKPVLVMRDKTERIEGIQAGTAILVGTDPEKIVAETRKLLDDGEAYKAMAKAVNPYGDGTTSEQIMKILSESR